MEQLLRAFILKISVCDAVLDHNPPGLLTPPSSGITRAPLAWSVFSGSYLAAASRLSSFLPFRTSLRVHLLQEATLISTRFGLPTDCVLSWSLVSTRLLSGGCRASWGGGKRLCPVAGMRWPGPDQTLASSGCTFTVLVHTREAATRNMEKIQVIKVR